MKLVKRDNFWLRWLALLAGLLLVGLSIREGGVVGQFIPEGAHIWVLYALIFVSVPLARTVLMRPDVHHVYLKLDEEDESDAPNGNSPRS